MEENLMAKKEREPVNQEEVVKVGNVPKEEVKAKPKAVEEKKAPASVNKTGGCLV